MDFPRLEVSTARREVDQLVEEILDRARRHRLLDVALVDDVLHPGNLQRLLPALVDHDHDYRLRCDVDSGLSYRYLRWFAEAGLVQVRSRIDSISTRKPGLGHGMTGCRTIRHLRNAQSAGVGVSWKYRYGHPGETDDHCHRVIEQMPALHHLAPPETVTPVVAEPGEPADAASPGVGAATADRLARAVDEWRRAHHTSRLVHCDLGDKIVLVNQRPGFDWSVHAIHDPVELAALRLLADPRSITSLTRRVAVRTGGPVSETRIGRLLVSWRRAGLVHHDAGRWVHVAALATNAEVIRPGARLPRPVVGGATAAATGPGITLHLWRDYHHRAGLLPGMSLGRVRVTGDAAVTVADLYRSGARRVALAGTTDLTADAEPATTVLALELLRELTAWGVVVDWRARLGSAPPPAALTHLYPPAAIDGLPARHQQAWADGFFVGRLHYRRGPGFLEIRDHRGGTRNRLLLDDPAYVAAVGRLVRDPTAQVPAEILADFTARSLILAVGDRHWWAPYRPRRWPQPPFLF
jgi:hypothetical protein